MKLFCLIILILLIVICNSYIISHNNKNRIHRYHTNLYLIQNILTGDELDAITTMNTNPEPVIIDFQKSKCIPCQKVAPLFEDLAKRYDAKAKFYKVDADSSPEALAVMKANGIRSVPTFHVWREGIRIDSIQGAHVDEVEYLLKQELQKMK